MRPTNNSRAEKPTVPSKMTKGKTAPANMETNKALAEKEKKATEEAKR